MLLTIEKLSKSYESASGTVEAMQDVSLEVDEGEFVSIVGPSGCGKSTLMEIVGGLIEPSGGEVTVGGNPVRGTDPSIGIVFQQESAFPWRTVAENAQFGLEMTGVAKDEGRRRAQETVSYTHLTLPTTPYV